MDYSQDRWEFEARIEARPGVAIFVSLSINNSMASDLDFQSGDLQQVISDIKAMLTNLPGAEAVIGSYSQYVPPQVSAL